MASYHLGLDPDSDPDPEPDFDKACTNSMTPTNREMILAYYLAAALRS
jgi:hypothetical protein